MYESDEKITNFVGNTLIKMFNMHRDVGKVFFQVKVPVIEVLTAYQKVYMKPININDPADKAIVDRFQKALNDGMARFEVYCTERHIRIRKIRNDSELYYEYDKRPKKKVQQYKVIRLRLEGNKVNLNKVGRLYDIATDFNLRISSEQVKEILELHPDLVKKLIAEGDSVAVGDDFLRALVEKITSRKFEDYAEEHGSNFISKVEELALTQGYQQLK